MSGQLSATSSGSMRAMSQTTRSGGCGRVLRHELVLGQQPLQLPAEEEVDPHEQDRRHAQQASRVRGRPQPTLSPPRRTAPPRRPRAARARAGVGSCTIAWPRRCEETRPASRSTARCRETPPTLSPARCATSLVESGPSSIASSPARVRPISAARAPRAGRLAGLPERADPARRVDDRRRRGRPEHRRHHRPDERARHQQQPLVR